MTRPRDRMKSGMKYSRKPNPKQSKYTRKYYKPWLTTRRCQNNGIRPNNQTIQKKRKKRRNLSKQLSETVRKNIEQQGQKQNKHDRKPSRRPKVKGNNWPSCDPNRSHKRDTQPRKTSMHGILGCHKSIRQGMARCYNVFDAQGRPQRPRMGPSEENERKPISTTQHKTP